MRERAHLIALWTLAVLASTVLITKGRGLPLTEGGSTAFFLDRSNGVRVKVTGIQGKSGVYCLPEDAVLKSVINMAYRGLAANASKSSDPATRLKDGDWIMFETYASEPAKISLKMMPAAERILLGIPLDPATMTESEWELLPGIGPTLARRIVFDRQYNGGFRSIRELERVSGIGKVTVDKLERYFSNTVTH
ncbi:ComEA family DNA-binding protein [Geobacter grbiciae]|uniref:ComEA family DNA-binding protein n=1 Tax=Geobacter grbiciae TaxID=155042 RepID=UPI001C00F3C3|nr:helix-hairpin-helix domain-containing protein [Geobacter grbiciae]MBT1074525.1 helix-hairpin-helix domain-containing protein [Geobacter grbiciae]